MGALGGVLQGAAGISAPVSVSFLNAMQLSRRVFIPTISLFFAATTAVQVPLLLAAGVMTPTILLIGVTALVPLFLGMRIGGWLAKSISARSFDRLILLMLAALTVKLSTDALF